MSKQAPEGHVKAAAMPPDACARMRVGACAQNAFNQAQSSQHGSGVALRTSAQTYGSLLLSMTSPSKRKKTLVTLVTFSSALGINFSGRGC